MTNKLTQDIRVDRWFYLFIFAHLVLWTVVPAVVRYNLPLDSIEGTIWGHQLEWGYDKNPFLNGWLTALATYLDGQSGWMVYLFSQLSVVLCFWAVWQLAKNMLTPVYALIAVMLLEGIQYYNFHSIDFNDNTLELSTWSLTIYFFYQALRSPKVRYWILTGVFAGLAMMAKYYTLTLLAGMGLFILSTAENRKRLTTLPPYLGLLCFLAIILPHTIWLFSHDFITVRYVFERGSSTPRWTNHFFFPAQFAWQQLQALAPALVMLAILSFGKSTPTTAAEPNLERFNKAFLFYVGLGPFLLTLFISLVLGTKLRAGWGMPLLSTWGIILMAALQPKLTNEKVNRFIGVTFTLMAVLVGGYSYSLINSADPSSANFPGHDLAQTVTQEWHDQFHTKLAYVGGSRWIGGNIEFYSPDHPAVFIEWDKRRAPWVNTDDMRKHGALFVWEVSRDNPVPDEMKNLFPTLRKTEIRKFSWLRNKHGLPPIQVAIAVLPPEAG